MLSTIPDLDSEIIKAARPKLLYRSLEEK
ncbi:MAG: hypothetical protein B7C55_01780, partial [Actinomycetales bacterium mxb001]